MRHIEGFDNKTISLSKMEEFAKGRELIRKSKIHRVIYFSDFRKSTQKSILRFQLEN